MDDVPEEVKQQRVEEIMEIQSQISYDLNQEKIGQTFRVLIDRKEGDNFIGRSEHDSPDVDNEILISAVDTYLPIGDFVNVEIIEAYEFDLIGKVID